MTLSPEQAASVIIDAVTHEVRMPSVFEDDSGVLLDSCRIDCTSGTSITLTFTKYFMRASSFVTFVIVSDLLGSTVVHLSTGGHKKFTTTDLGASAAFIGVVEEVLKSYGVD